MRPLHPSLQQIEAGLFGPAAAPAFDAQADDEGEEDHEAAGAATTGEHADRAPEAIPAYLQDAFARRAATLHWPTSLAPGRGQIRVMDAVREVAGVRRILAQPIGVLLRHQVAGNLWQAWLVSPEADYATSWDVVLGEQDAPLDPLAAMVRCELDCRVVLAGNARVLAVLSPERMQAIEAVAAQAHAQGAQMPGEPGAGLVVRRETPDGFVVATGTALAGPDDPRRQHRVLYRRLHEEIEAAAAAVAQQSSRSVRVDARVREAASWWQRWFGWRGAAAAFATLLVVQSAVLVGVLRQGPEEVIYRDGVPIRPGKPVPAIRVIFSPDIPHARVMRAVRDISGIIVSGPNEHGEFVIILRELAPPDAIARLRVANVIDSAEALQGGWGGR